MSLASEEDLSEVSAIFYDAGTLGMNDNISPDLYNMELEWMKVLPPSDEQLGGKDCSINSYSVKNEPSFIN